MKNSRRSFLKIAGISALGMGASPVNTLFASSGVQGVETHKNKDALTAGQWGLVIDTRKISSSDDLEPMIEA